MPLARHRPRAHLRARDDGLAAVEFALVVPLLLILLLGTVEFGRAYSQQLAMQYAAREAARQIALTYDDPLMTPTILGIEVESTLEGLLPIADLSDLYSYSIDLCSTTASEPDEAVVELEDRLRLAVPIPDDALDAVPIRARAQMPCEG